ncbi:unnamed protein product [Phytophthora fragariaefolia]|uniref:Unnamed protein product n=1 Tax=Phytophthora fragariaefolia TaxID=1490495 RepID=A0A9W6U9Z1_9STRA|nr:unnamed protein product [Phytophthora fragariaefolia]
MMTSWLDRPRSAVTRRPSKSSQPAPVAMQLKSSASLAPHSPGLRLQIPKPFDPADGTEADEAMLTRTWRRSWIRFNLIELAFEHEQRRIVRYLANALAPVSFKSVIWTKLTLQENKMYKNEVVPFCSWVTQLMREFMTWERAAQAASPPDPASQSQQPRGSGRGHQGVRSAGAGRGGRGGQSGHDRSDGGRESRNHQDGVGSGPPVAPIAAGNDPKLARGACLKCNLADHQVRDCPRCEPGEAAQRLKDRR